MIKCCIFDLDGTILDTIATITYYVNVSLKKFGIVETTEDECKNFVGEGPKKLITRALNSKNAFSDEFFAKVHEDYINTYDNDPYYLTKPFLGIDCVLKELKSRGIKLAVLSNKQDKSAKATVNHFFPGIFDVVVGSKPEYPMKPDPTAAKEILKELDVEPENTAWIGDTPTDVLTGINLGAALIIGVVWGFRKREELECAGAGAIAEKVTDILQEVIRVD